MNKEQKKILEAERLETRKQLTVEANAFAVKKGFTNASEMMKTLNVEMESKLESVSRNAGLLAGNFVENMLLLCLYQEIKKSDIPSYISNFVENYETQYIKEGNSFEFTRNLITGGGNYDEEFVPTAVQKELQESFILSMYKANGTLEDNVFKYRKGITINRPKWLPYFKSGALGTFITNIQEQVRDSFNLTRFDKLATMVKSLTPQKTITGTAANLYDAFANEIYPEIEKMTYMNTEYNYSATSKVLHAADPSNLVMLVPMGLKSKIQNGIIPQLFNKTDFGKVASSNSINANIEIVSLGHEFNIVDESTPISMKTTEYIAQDTIYVIDKELFKFIKQIDTAESQSWARNMLVQIYLHVWYGLGIVPWGKCFKYTNANINTLP